MSRHSTSVLSSSTTAMHYKEAKEAFVSQLQGGSVYKINVASLTALTTYSLWACLRSRNALSTYADAPGYPRTRRLWTGAMTRAWLVEVAILILPIVLALTVLSNHLLALNAVILSACTYVVLFYPAPVTVKPERKGHKRHWSRKDSEDEGDDTDEDNNNDDDDRVARTEHLSKQKQHLDMSSEDPLRISVDSAADLAFADAAPPTQFVPPGVDEGVYSNHSSLSSSESASILTGLGLHSIDYSKAGTSIPSASPGQRKTNDALTSSSALRHASHASTPVSGPQRRLNTRSHSSGYVPSNQPFLSVYRAHMMLMTIICILAVDFQAFPREFAKCETWGTSLMDLGVGSFVFSMGIVSALPMLRSPRHRFKPLRAQLLRDARRSVPLFLLGAIRVIMVKGVEYPEHLSEYGVHWNFFITLALLPFFGTLSRPLTKLARFSALGLALSCSHQIGLSFTDLGHWTASNSVLRTSFVSQNKEGIVSFPGYLSLFLLGLDLGHYVLPRDPYLAYRRASKTRKREKTDKLAMLLASFAILWWAAYYIASLGFGGVVSRRLANLPYVLWVTAYNSTFLLCYVLIYMVLLQPLQAHGKTSSDGHHREQLQESKTPTLLSSLNRSAFLVFLVANLLTGLINVSIHTMYSSHLTALFILTLYTTLCLALATQAHLCGWKLPI